MAKLRYLIIALSLVWKSSRKWTILLLISQLFQAILPLILLYLSKLIIDSLSELKITVDFNTIGIYILIFGFIQLLIAIINNYQQLITETQQQLVSDYMSTVIIAKATEIDISYYENAEFINTFHQAQRQALFRPVQILRNLTDFFQSTLLIISLASLLIFLHWSIALILVCFAMPVAWVKWHYSKKIFDWEKNRTELERESAYLNSVLTTDEYAKEVRIFNLGKLLLDRFKLLRTKLFDEKYRINSQRAKAGVIARSSEIIALTVCYGFIAWRAFVGSITIGDLVMFLQAFQRGQSALQKMLSSIVGLYSNRLFITHVFDLLNVKSILVKPQSFKPLERLNGIVDIKDLNFNYPNIDMPVLKNINLQFKVGQVIAFVGENGSGKTTLIKLLCRLYDPVKGGIYWDNTNIKDVALSALRKRISIICQDFSKYQFTIGENIQIGDFEKTISQEKIINAAKFTGASKFIETYPKQYNQRLGRWFKQGKELSGGQWQKIALSRAFYKDADLIILDEPSSSIDPIAEAEIFDRFRNMSTDKILILITHRLYNLKIADQIVVLHKGEVAEIGTHEELINKNGQYSKMFEKQADN